MPKIVSCDAGKKLQALQICVVSQVDKRSKLHYKRPSDQTRHHTHRPTPAIQAQGSELSSKSHLRPVAILRVTTPPSLRAEIASGTLLLLC